MSILQPNTEYPQYSIYDYSPSDVTTQHNHSFYSTSYPKDNRWQSHNADHAYSGFDRHQQAWPRNPTCLPA